MDFKFSASSDRSEPVHDFISGSSTPETPAAVLPHITSSLSLEHIHTGDEGWTDTCANAENVFSINPSEATLSHCMLIGSGSTWLNRITSQFVLVNPSPQSVDSLDKIKPLRSHLSWESNPGYCCFYNTHFTTPLFHHVCVSLSPKHCRSHQRQHPGDIIMIWSRSLFNPVIRHMIKWVYY